jgi:hypothetical protein
VFITTAFALILHVVRSEEKLELCVVKILERLDGMRWEGKKKKHVHDVALVIN